MIAKTARMPGKADPVEVKQFQSRHGIVADGKFGDQSMGQVVEIEKAYGSLSARHREIVERYAKLLAKDEPECNFWGFIIGGLAMIGVWASGALDWVRSLFG